MPWTVDCWLDPACPATRHTARWIGLVAERVHLEIRWHAMSLAILNEHRDDDPEGDPDGYLWIPARVAAAVGTEHGSAALGAFYDALWTNPDGAERAWIGDFGEALRRSRLPEGLGEVGDSTAYDEALRASHRAGVDLVDAEVGTPILAVTSPAGDRRAFFGPVLDGVPARDEASRLWEALALLGGVGGFRELKA